MMANLTTGVQDVAMGDDALAAVTTGHEKLAYGVLPRSR